MLLPHKAPDREVCPAGEVEDDRIEVGLGRWTIQGVVHLLSGMLADATDKHRIPANPAARLKIPEIFPKPPFFWSGDEARKLLLVLPEPWRTLVDLDLHAGQRWREIAGLKCGYVDTEQNTIRIRGVLTRKGWRDYPKSKKSCRDVPIPRHLADPLWKLVADRRADDLVFTAPEGGRLNDHNFRNRVFTPAIVETGIQRGTPHDMRHAAASWLVQDGVDLYRVQALLGHEKSTTTERYAHLAPTAHKAIIDAWASNPLDVRDAPATHGVGIEPPVGLESLTEKGGRHRD
jgi:integrase